LSPPPIDGKLKPFYRKTPEVKTSRDPLVHHQFGIRIGLTLEREEDPKVEFPDPLYQNPIEMELPTLEKEEEPKVELPEPLYQKPIEIELPTLNNSTTTISKTSVPEVSLPEPLYQKPIEIELPTLPKVSSPSVVLGPALYNYPPPQLTLTLKK